ncbi:hypothetical protein [Streptomyces sp. NPDC057496]|uniref:hypothetical protein n=1 Tax=Streptomyces sp. NPDC057496 TaxID=3346149 RepID=UPI0036B69D9F
MRVLAVSGWDQGGSHLFSALAEDVTAVTAVDAPGTEVVLEHLAVTEQQTTDHELPTAPPKASDHRSFNGISTTQAKTLPRRSRRRAENRDHLPPGHARPGSTSREEVFRLSAALRRL